MKKIIDKKTYNTDTAIEVCSRQYSNRRDFGYCWETLYVTKKGAYFLYGEGGPNSKYRKVIGQNEWCGGEAITPMTQGEAMAWAEKYGTAEEYADFFGEPEEAGDDSRQCRIREAREARGLSRAELARMLGAPLRTLEDWETGRRTPPEWIEKIIVDRILEVQPDDQTEG